MQHHPIRDLAHWRDTARGLLQQQVAPADVALTEAATTQEALPALFEAAPAAAATATHRVPPPFLDLARRVSCHRDPQRWDRLYRVLWRITHGERHLLQVDVDDDIRALHLMDRAVKRDIHQMHAYVRFRKVSDGGQERYIAWYRPDHYIVEEATPFFARRFGTMHWAILTPDLSAYWDTRELRFGPGLPRSEAPPEDALEDLWRSYYAAVFNPARLKLKKMRQDMPLRRWQDLPELQNVPQLIASASERVQTMATEQPTSASPFVPVLASIDEMRVAVQECRGCHLCDNGTRAVLSEGPADAEVVLVGEQPGDEDERQGRPFSGPSGRLLDRALVDAGLDRSQLYVTNTVKHFKHEIRGKRRIHQNPNAAEVSACRPWLEMELQVIRPKLIVCLGATAAGALVGRTVTISRERGVFRPHPAAMDALLITTHPSAVLRVPDPDGQQAAYEALVRDLSLVRERITTRAA